MLLVISIVFGVIVILMLLTFLIVLLFLFGVVLLLVDLGQHAGHLLLKQLL